MVIMRKTCLIVLAALVYIVGLSGVAAAADIKLVLNGEDVTAAVDPQVKDGRIYLPLRVLAEECGAALDYADQTVYLHYNGIQALLSLNGTDAVVTYPGQSEPEIVPDVSPYLSRGRTYVPLRSVVGLLPGWQIDYIADNKTVIINSGVKPVSFNGKQLCYMIKEDGFGMGRQKYLYSNVAPIYTALTAGQVREVAEPQTGYGSQFIVYDYYVLTERLHFYQNVPSANYDMNSEPAELSYELYHMYEGEPEFGDDSRNLLYDVSADRWYVLQAEQYDKLLDLLAAGELLR